MKEAKVFKEMIFHVLAEQPINENMKSVIRIVRWDTEKDKGELRLEKRLMTLYKGVARNSKVIGFNAKDWAFLKEKQNEITAAFKDVV